MSRARVWTIANWTMAALFAFSVAVQINDPDPIRWILVYGCAAAICVLEARTGAPWPAPAIVLLLTIAAALWIARGLDAAPIGQLFDQWEMRDTAVEETREVGGLGIVAAWMAAVTVAAVARARRRRGPMHATSAGEDAHAR